MSDVKLYLDGELVSIDPNTTISETKQINNLFELKDRQTNYTNNFTLLLDNPTSKVLNRLGDTYNTSNKPYRLLSPKLYRGGTATITDGKFIIKSVKNRKKVSGSIQDGNVSLYDSMGTNKLSDLPLDELEHIFSESSVISTFNNTWQDGYIYALANYGVLDLDVLDFNYQNPSIFVKWLWEKIFSHHGYTYSYRGDINPFNSEHFESRILSVDKGFLFSDSTQSSDLIVDLSTELTLEETSDLIFGEVLDSDNIHNYTSLGQSVINFKDSLFYRISIEGELDLGAKLVVYNNNAKLKEIVGNGEFTDVIYGDFDNESYITFKIETEQEVNATLEVKVYKNDGVNTLNFSRYITSIKQKDFFKSILHMYGLMMQRVKGTNHFEFITMSDMFVNRGEAQDLSNKYHNDRLLSETFRFGTYGQTNYMRYQYDDDEVDYADGSFTIDDLTLNESVDMFKSPYKAPKFGDALIGTEPVYSVLLYSSDVDENGNTTNIKSKKTKPYIGTYKMYDTSLDYTLSKIGVNGTYSGEIPFFSFESQNFNYLISFYYAGFVATINRTKVYNVELELLPSDVANFDFLRLVYLRQEQKYFYCNKISSYKENKVTKVQLIEVNTSQQTYGEYADDYNEDYNI